MTHVISEFAPARISDVGAALFPEDGHCAVVRFTGAICFLPDMHALEVVFLQQMIAAVFNFMDSVQLKVAEWTHPGLV